ncbi:lactonase family protein [Gaetbulibacter saemankumensis]|uniref:lactonase family protein n=1 Tax=Gaetbulibacter saemankumensis TaxID=311208 RepID=UPI000425D851|nr:lactonase family protein [Gaetbulibacter saemankumensis]
MKYISLFFIISIFLFSCKEPSYTLYIGTYTKGDSEGIYRAEFNPESGKLTNLTLAIPTENPSFLSYSPNKKYIYAVGEENDGTVAAFEIEKNKQLKLLNRVKSFGGAPCHISVNNEGTLVVASNYVGGNVALYNIKPDGSLNEASQIFDHNTEIEKSHAHSAQFVNNQLYVADLGRNAMYLYESENLKPFTLSSSSMITFTENAGPRHFTFTKDKQFLYIINEYASTITTAKKQGNTYLTLNHTNTLSENYDGQNSCADIHLSKDERFLYGSNRGENTIAVFKRDTSTGKLQKIQNMSVHGDWPRNFTIDPTGKFLLVANKKSNNISVFKIDSNSGKLEFTNDFHAPTPVCLLF